MRPFVLLLGFLAVSAGSLPAQDLEETLRQLGREYAMAYTRPLADALGANLNTGLYALPLGRNPGGLHVYVGLQAFGTLLPETGQTFDLVYDGRVDLTTRLGQDEFTVNAPARFHVTDAPTLFGDDDPAVATVTARFDTTVNRFGIAVPVSFDTTLTREIVGGLLQTNIVPAAVPHLRIGTLLGTSLTVRWLPHFRVTDVGGMELFGFGIGHSISQYAPLLPIHLAVQLSWQELKAEDADGDRILKASTFAGSIVASRRFGALTLYGGLQTERATLDVDYELDSSGEFDEPDDADPVPISFSTTGAARARGTVGLSLSAGPLQLTADYSIGQVRVLSTSLGVVF